TYRTREDELMTAATGDDFSTRSMNNGTAAQPASASETPFEDVPSTPPPAGPAPTAPSTAPAPATEAATVQAALPPNVPSAAKAPATSSPSGAQSTMNAPSITSDAGVSFNRLTSIAQPTLPDIAPLLAALSTLDGQVMSLQEQLNATQDAVRNHETEIAQTTNQLRAGVRRVSERMDATIADVARSREA